MSNIHLTQAEASAVCAVAMATLRVMSNSPSAASIAPVLDALSQAVVKIEAAVPGSLPKVQAVD